MHTVAIIGCGATGLSLLAQLVEGLVVAPNALRLLVFEKSDLLGTGLAYACHPDLMMNSPAGLMTIIDKDNHHFLRWLAANRNKWESLYPSLACVEQFDPEWFAPRALAGLYLKDMFMEYRRKAVEKGVIVDVIHEEVVAIQENNGTSIVSVNGIYQADTVVLTTGNVRVSPNYPEVANSPSFYTSQYFDIDYSSLRGKRVLVLGTSLGAIDTAVLLHDSDSHPNVVLASKRGRLPAVKTEISEHVYSKLNAAEVDRMREEKGKFGLVEVDELVKRELLETYPNVASLSDFFIPLVEDDAAALFEKEVEMAQKGEALWHRFQFAWIHAADYLWENMETETDKRKLMMYYMNNIHRYTSAFHLDVALKVRTWLRKGTLRLASIPDPASLSHHSDSDDFSAQLSFQNGPVEETRFDVVIDASGLSKNYSDSSPLYRDLREKDLVRYNKFGGLDLDVETMRVNGTQKLTAPVYAAGCPTFGSVLYTNYILVGVKHAAIIARQIKCQI